MNKPPRYLFEVGEDWERLTDTITGKYMEEHHLNVDDVFYFLELGNKLEIRELNEEKG